MQTNYTQVPTPDINMCSYIIYQKMDGGDVHFGSDPFELRSKDRNQIICLIKARDAQVSLH